MSVAKEVFKVPQSALLDATTDRNLTPEIEAKEETHLAGFGVKLATFFVIVLPFIGLLVAMIGMWGWGFHWVELGLFGVMYLLTGLGITVGFHRLFTHKSFETPAAIKFIFGVLGSMAVQGSLFQWVAFHRSHHQHSDKADDPHSPHLHGDTFMGMVRGFWFSHMGWFFRPFPQEMMRYVKDLNQSPMLRQVSNLFFVWVAIGLIIPAVVGFFLIGGWLGALLGLLWGGFVRIFFVHHVTWSINSVCHLWGFQTYDSNDESRNNFLFGLLGLGEGWHNNHHAFPTSARHGLKWWQIDISYYVIKGLELVGLASKVRLPSAAESKEIKAKVEA